MHISARVDYGIQAALVLARAQRQALDAATGVTRELSHATLIGDDKGFCSTQDIAAPAGIPVKFLEGIMADLRRNGIVKSRRGSLGGFCLAQPAAEIYLADIVRALDGPLAAVRGVAPEEQKYKSSAEHLTRVWVALRASMREVLENCSLEQVETGELPPEVTQLLDNQGAWRRR